MTACALGRIWRIEYRKERRRFRALGRIKTIFCWLFCCLLLAHVVTDFLSMVRGSTKEKVRDPHSIFFILRRAGGEFQHTKSYIKNHAAPIPIYNKVT